MGSCGNDRLWEGWDCSGTLGNAQGKIGNALRCSNSHLEALNCGCGEATVMGSLPFVRRPTQVGKVVAMRGGESGFYADLHVSK